MKTKSKAKDKRKNPPASEVAIVLKGAAIIAAPLLLIGLFVATDRD